MPQPHSASSTSQLQDLIRQSIPDHHESWRTSITNFLCSITSSQHRPFRRLHRRALIAVTGLDSAGKSTLLRHLARPERQPVHTRHLFVGAAYEVLHCGLARLLAFDVGGGRPSVIFRLEAACFQLCDALVFVVDAVDRERLVEGREELMRACRGEGEEGLRGDVPVLVLVNKVASVGAASLAEIAKLFRIGCADEKMSSLQLWGSRTMRLFGIDMLSDQGISEALTWLVSELNAQRCELDQESMDKGSTLADA